MKIMRCHENGSFCEKDHCSCKKCRSTDSITQSPGDKIRAMSDEDLARELHKLYLMSVNRGEKLEDISTNWCDLRGGCDGREDRECTPELHQACILRWLKAERGKKEKVNEQKA